MAIYNQDGTPYVSRGSLQQFDPKGPNSDLFNRFNKEVIEIGGSPVYYHELFVGKQSIDKLYIEARNKMWSQHPIEFMAMYEPVSSQLAMTLFGPDNSSNTMVFYTNYKHFLERVNHPPVIGSKIYSPSLKEWWEVMDRRTSSPSQGWNIITLEIHCVRFQESLTSPNNATQPKQDYDII